MGVRFTEEEYSYIDWARAGLSRHAYVKAQALDPFNPPKRQRKQPTEYQRYLSEVLARLNATHIPANLNQLAKAANSGSLILTPEVAADLHEARQLLGNIRELLLKIGMDLSEGEP